MEHSIFFGQNKYHLCTDAQNFFIWVGAPRFLIDSQNSLHYFSQSEANPTRAAAFSRAFFPLLVLVTRPVKRNCLQF